MSKKHKDVFHIIEGEGRNNWTKIGVAFENNDGSLNVLVNYLPTNLARQGTLNLNIRDPKNANGGGKKKKSDDDDF